MILNQISRLTSNWTNLFITKKTSQILANKVLFCNFGTSSAFYQKKKKNKKKGWFLGKRKKEENEFKIITPGNCASLPSPILNPLCKVAMVVGGSSGFGYTAADELLSRGAKNVIIADKDNQMGEKAVQRLCNAYGRNRAWFLHCDIRDPSQLEGVFEMALCRQRAIHILFTDLDQNTKPLSSSICFKPEEEWSNTRRASLIGLKYIGKENGGPGGIIVNCASIFGFMGWPENPAPVYCHKEAVIETTIDIANENTFEKTGVRFVAICPTNKQFEKISIPDFPGIMEPNDQKACMMECLPLKKIMVGPALTHVMAQANTGTTWVVPPYPSLRELPRLIHFPKSPDELVDPKVYDEKPCPVAIESHCAKILEDIGPTDPNTNCELSTPKKKCKTLFSNKK